MHRRTSPAVIAVVLLAGAGVAVTSTAAISSPDEPPAWPAHTVVDVEGDAHHGFSIVRLDGSTEHPPTLSESTAECEEYDDATAVAVCVAEVRTRFDSLAELQLSLRWAAAQPR